MLPRIHLNSSILPIIVLFCSLPVHSQSRYENPFKDLTSKVSKDVATKSIINWKTESQSGSRPQFISVIAPDTLIRPSSGFALFEIRANVTDPDSIDDITDVWFYSRDSGIPNYPFYLQHLNGIVWVDTFQISSQTVLKTYRFVFFAKDIEGNISDSVVHRISVVNQTTTQDYSFRQGFDMNLWMSNRGVVGRMAGGQADPTDGRLGLEYPINSRIEHLNGAGLWIGAIVDTSHGGPPAKIKAVTTSFDGGDPPVFEMFGNPNGSDSFFTTTTDIMNGKNRRGYDDDGDGYIDEDPLDGIDNDFDGKIDEDYGAISESDILVSYTDYYNHSIVQNHTPLGLKVWQRSYAWGNSLQSPIIFLDYLIINEGQKKLDSVCLGYFADGDVGPLDKPGYQTRNYSGYLPDLRTAYIHNPIDTPSTPIGITIISCPKPLDSINFTFQWFSKNELPATDQDKFNLMSRREIKPDEYPNLSDTRFLLSFGSLGQLQPSEAFHLVLAVVSGDRIQSGRNNMKENAQRAIIFYMRGYVTPIVPPSPPLRLSQENGRVKLDWHWQPGDPRFDPMETWDDSNKIADALPYTHWRKINPPQGKIRGGRIFEGFKVWRCDTNNFQSKYFQQIAQFDVNDDLGFGLQTGLQFSMIDTNTIPKHRYWYSVTSYSIPDWFIICRPSRCDTLWSVPSESWIGLNASSIDLTTNVNVDRNIIPSTFKLYQAYPNPFNPQTRISFSVPKESYITLKVYDLLGREVATLVQEKKQQGEYSITWNAERVPSGVYYYRLVAVDPSLRSGQVFYETKKMVVTK